ncbi:nuclear protein 1 isoform X2 [Prionailurus viverrinus]|uniref:nuclear protein 1 isoform X2 n=1 Tax=Prionailurus viverrinus TaxID=61388 RepID=UPI001FF4B8AA|nr:nuclear protein 1 isoform X2 [Prionailurus viverrinus]
MATCPQAASPAQQPPGPEDEDLSLDEYDLYNLAPSYLGLRPPHLGLLTGSQEQEVGKVAAREKLPPTPTAPAPVATRGSW